MILLAGILGITGLQADVASLLNDPSFQGARVSMVIKRFQGEILVARSPDELLIPASTMKLIPVTLAFEKLGAEFTPLTIAWRNGSTARIIGGGDPSLTVAKLQQLAEAIGTQPGDRIEFDDGLFGKEIVAPVWGAKEKSYCPPIGALMVNRSRMEIWASPGKVWAKPHSFGITIQGAPTTGAGKPIVQWLVPGKVLKVTGKMPKGSKARAVGSLSLTDPGMAAASVIGKSPVRVDIASPSFAVLPPNDSGMISAYQFGSTKVGVLRAASVSQIAQRALTESDNFYAETLLRLCGGEAGTSGSWGDSISMAHEFLSNVGLSPTWFVLSDGSGLSRYNRLSARSLTTLIERDLLTSYGELFLDCMAVPGKGTLKNRLSGQKVWAKTGSLNGVVALAGVAQPSEKRRLIFAILVNGGRGPANAQRDAIDKIVTAIGK